MKQRGKGKQKLSGLNENSLKTCSAILEITKKDNLLYQDIHQLPSTVDSFSGFHKDCYQRFTGLPKKQRADLLMQMKNRNKKNKEEEKSPLL